MQVIQQELLISAPAFFTSISQPAYAAMTADREVDVEQTGTGSLLL